jgi:hypothetical protein
MVRGEWQTIRTVTAPDSTFLVADELEGEVAFYRVMMVD